MVRMSSWAASLILIQEGLEPNFQMVCRDRNRLAMQADILGVYAHGIRNMLCLSGDHCQFGDHPTAKGVFDIDSMQLIDMVKKMRDEGKFLGGADIEEPPKIFIGAAANPFADPFEWRVHRLAKKIDAGVISSRPSASTTWRNSGSGSAGQRHGPDRKGLHPGRRHPHEERRYGQVHEEQGARHGRARRDHQALQGAEPKGKVAEEGIKIACEQIEEFKEMKGVHGVHLMAIEWEHKVPEIAEQAKVLPPHSHSATAPHSPATCAGMQRCVGIGGRIQAAAFETLDDFADGSCLPAVELNPGGIECLDRVRAAISCDHCVHFLRGDLPGGLNTGTTSLSTGIVSEHLERHVLGLDDHKIGASAESGIEGGIQIFSC
jgi:methylenetetrahydrofolate reductase (NADPH)